MDTEPLVVELWALADRIWEAVLTSEEARARFGPLIRYLIMEAPAPIAWERGHLRLVPPVTEA